MERRIFGATGLSVSALGLGCARVGGIFQRDPNGFADLLRAALDGGIDFFDTADMYSQGESEALLGRALAGIRDRVIIASKAGYVLPPQRRWVAAIKPLARGIIGLLGIRREQLPALVRGVPSQDFSPAHLERAVEGSLRRLRTDRIDVFQLHSPPADVIARGDWLPAIERLKRAGKILHYGIACDTCDDAPIALQQPGVASVQIPVNLLERRGTQMVLPPAREKNVAVIARECLANGLLVKDASDVDLKSYCRSPADEERRARQLAVVRKLAQERGVPLAQLALNFVLGLEGVSVALVGARTRAQLEALLRIRRHDSFPVESLQAIPA